MGPLGERIRQRIQSDGPIPFDEFMEAALYDPDQGFFAAGTLRSAEDGDFLTSPEVSSWFGRTLGRFVSAVAADIGTDGFTIVDVGAGSGSLLTPLVESLDFRPAVVAVERSEAARAALRALDGVEVLDTLPSGPLKGVLIGNEVLDNVPAALVRRTTDGWAELRVGMTGVTLALEEHDPRPTVAAWADRHAADVAEGGLVEVQLGSENLVETVVRCLEAGAAVFFDYGDTGDGLANRREIGTLRTYRAHHLGPDPLLEPGETDITFDVDFSAMVAVARATGASWVELVTQREFLERWGLRDELSRLRHLELEHARAGDSMARLTARSVVSEIETLLHPRGLGDFRALVVGVGTEHAAASVSGP